MQTRSKLQKIEFGKQIYCFWKNNINTMNTFYMAKHFNISTVSLHKYINIHFKEEQEKFKQIKNKINEKE